MDLAKIAMMDCGFELIRIFQRELWWIFKLNTDSGKSMSIEAMHGIELHTQRNITPPRHINIDLRAFQGKADMTWETSSTELAL